MDTIDLEHEQRLTAVESLARSNKHRIDELSENSKALHSLATSVEVMVVKQNNMAEKQDGMVDTVTGIREELAEIKERPAARWESLMDKIIWAVVAAVIGYILAQIGL